MTPLKIFCGYDPREKHGFHVFLESIIQHAGVKVAFIPLCGEQRDGSNTFTYERFLVPYYCGFRGHAMFLDGSDMLVREDVTLLSGLFNPKYAVQVVRHDYRTRHARKYIGTAMEAPNQDYPRKNWSSVVLWNCEHPKNEILTPQYVRQSNGAHLHRFAWLQNDDIGALPYWWNHLVGEQEVRGNVSLAHFTLGIPHIPEYAECDFSDEYRAIAQGINEPVPAPEEAKV